MEINFDELIPIVGEENVIPTVEEETITESIKDDSSKEIIEDEETVEPEENDESENEDFTVSTRFYKEIASHGYVEDDKDQYTYDDIDKLITKDLPEKITSEIIESTPEIGRQLMDYVFTKGKDLNKEDLTNFVNTYLTDLDSQSITIDSDESARSYLKDVYSKQGFKETVVEVMLDTLEDENELQKEAKSHLENSPKKSDELLNQEKINQQELQKQNEMYIQSINEEFNSLDWDTRKVNRLKQNLFNGTVASILTKASKSPKATVQLADIADYWDDKTESFNFDKLIQKANSKETKSLKDRIEADMFNSTPATKSRTASKNKKLLSEDFTPIV